MKYKIGEKVKYDSGDWWLYGTVCAVFEHPVCPCYRLNVERMEKKTCKFSITQFEFELEPSKEPEPILVTDQKPEPILEPVPEKKQRKKRELKQGTEPEKDESTQEQTKAPAKRKTGEKWKRNLEQYLKGERSYAIYNWVTKNRQQYKTGELTEEKKEKLMQINFPFGITRKKDENGKKADTHKRGKGNEWEINFESYQKGEKNDIISSWIADNKREFKTGKLTEAKYEKLVGINFPFDVAQTKDDNWEKQLEEWKTGERRNKAIQQWKQRSLKLYSENRLSVDRILKLREVGILK